jgi:hypothetical protein
MYLYKTNRLMENKKITHTESTQSFDIIGDTPISCKKNQKFPSNDSIDDDYINLLDEEIVDNNILPVPTNTPRLSNNDYDNKINEIIIILNNLKSDVSDSKTKKNIKSLEKHIDKLKEKQNKNIKFEEIVKEMQLSAKNDKHMNKYLKNIYATN